MPVLTSRGVNQAVPPSGYQQKHRIPSVDLDMKVPRGSSIPASRDNYPNSDPHLELPKTAKLTRRFTSPSTKSSDMDNFEEWKHINEDDDSPLGESEGNYNLENNVKDIKAVVTSRVNQPVLLSESQEKHIIPSVDMKVVNMPSIPVSLDKYQDNGQRLELPKTGKFTGAYASPPTGSLSMDYSEEWKHIDENDDSLYRNYEGSSNFEDAFDDQSEYLFNADEESSIFGHSDISLPNVDVITVVDKDKGHKSDRSLTESHDQNIQQAEDSSTDPKLPVSGELVFFF